MKVIRGSEFTQANRIRYFDDETGTFDVIVENLDKISSGYKNIRLTIRINISSPNFDEYAPLIEELFKKISTI